MNEEKKQFLFRYDSLEDFIYVSFMQGHECCNTSEFNIECPKALIDAPMRKPVVDYNQR